MTISDLYEICTTYRGVTEGFPFDKDTLVFKVGGKMFLLTGLSSWENGEPAINLKCDPEKAIELREEFEAVKPGYHMSKTHWNTVSTNKDLSLIEIKKLIDHSYELVFNGLTKKLQKEILEENLE